MNLSPNNVSKYNIAKRYLAISSASDFFFFFCVSVREFKATLPNTSERVFGSLDYHSNNYRGRHSSTGELQLHIAHGRNVMLRQLRPAVSEGQGLTLAAAHWSQFPAGPRCSPSPAAHSAHCPVPPRPAPGTWGSPAQGCEGPGHLVGMDLIISRSLHPPRPAPGVQGTPQTPSPRTCAALAAADTPHPSAAAPLFPWGSPGTSQQPFSDLQQLQR